LDDDSGLDLDEDEERNIGTAISHVDLSKLKKSTAGDGPQSAMLAMTPVSNISELNFIVKLADSHVTNTSKNKKTWNTTRVKKRAFNDAIAVDYVTLASAFNACVVNAFASSSKDFHLTGLRLKSPAHLKDFLERADEALVIAHSIAGVRNKLVDIRRRLRDCTSAIVPAGQGMSAKTSSGVCAVLPAKAASSKPCRAPRSCPKLSRAPLPEPLPEHPVCKYAPTLCQQHHHLAISFARPGPLSLMPQSLWIPP